MNIIPPAEYLHVITPVEYTYVIAPAEYIGPARAQSLAVL